MERKVHILFTLIYYVTIIGFILIILKYVLPVVMPFLTAFLIATLLQIPAKKIAGNSENGKRICAVFLCFIFYLLLTVSFFWIGINLWKEMGYFITKIVDFYKKIFEPFVDMTIIRFESTIAKVDRELAGELGEMIQINVTNIGQKLSEGMVNTAKNITDLAKKIPIVFVNIIVTIVATFFLAGSYEYIIKIGKNQISEKNCNSLIKTWKFAKNMLGIYIKSYGILFCITFIELAIGLLLLQIPHAILIAFAIAVFDVLPVLGTGGILLPWAAVLFLIKKGRLAVGILLLYIIITVIRNIIEPKIVGKRIGLHPFITLAAMFIGLKILGISGMIIAPILCAFAVNMKNKYPHNTMSEK